MGVARQVVAHTLEHELPTIAKAVAFSLFLSIPSALLVVLGVFGLAASPATITRVVADLRGPLPADVATQLQAELSRVAASRSASLTLLALGLVLAVWSLTGAMTTLMWGLNAAYGSTERRGFVRRRGHAAGLAGAALIAFAVVVVFLVLGPLATRWIGHATGHPAAVTWVWWVAQWPITIVVMLAAFGVVLWLGPDTDDRRWRPLTAGAVAAALLWLVASGVLAVYTAQLGAYNKTWGSLAGVVVLLVWLWVTSLAILVGAEIDAEIERNRRAGTAPG